MAHSNFTIPYLIAGDTFRLDLYFEGTVTGTPTWQLFVNGQAVSVVTNGANLGNNLWRFDIVVPSDAMPGKSARVRITASVDAASSTSDLHSAVADPVKLIEREKSYRYRQDAFNETNKTADVTVTDPV